MHTKSFATGLVVGAVVASGVFWIFGDTIRGEVADTTEEVGRTVEKAGETIRKEAGKLDD